MGSKNMSKKQDKPKDEKEDAHLRWSNVSELYDLLDTVFVDYGQEHDMTFMEMDLVIYMINEKIFQQKVMTLGMADTGTVGINGSSGMYR